MNDSRYRLLLPSGRGVELQTLDFEQIDKAEIAVAKMRGEGDESRPTGFGGMTEYQKAVALEGLRMMVVGASVNLLASSDELLAAEFKVLTPGMLEDVATFKSYFTAKDVVVLRNRFAVEHDVTMPELSKVMEKKVDVHSA